MLLRRLQTLPRFIMELHSSYLFSEQYQTSKLSGIKVARKEMLEDVKFKQNHLKTIEEVNKYFLGIRMNTKYAKFYNEDTFTNADNFSNRRLSDLPFKHDEMPKKEFEKTPIQGLSKRILEKLEAGALEKKLRHMAEGFFLDLVERKRTVKIEPNFDRQARRVISSLMKENYKFKIEKNPDAAIEVTSVEMFKGLEVIRNNNYSIDSYEVLKQQHFTHYKLWEKGTYKIPEQQWFTKRNILMRIYAKVISPYNLTVLKNKENVAQLFSYPHQFVFEMDLKLPPKYAEFKLTEWQYLKSYEPILNNLTITNVDGRNPYFAMTYQESQKKSILINKLV